MKARLLPLLAVLVTGLLLVHGFATPLSAPYTEIASPPYRTQIGAPHADRLASARPTNGWAPGSSEEDGEPGAGPTHHPEGSGAPHPMTGTIPVEVAWNPELTPEPTPKPRLITGGIGGWASFYDDGPGIYVALPGWTRDSPIRTVVVCANVGLWRCATASVWTSCGCHTNTDHPKIVDLSPDLMALITGWDRTTMTNRGVVRVTVQEIP